MGDVGEDHEDYWDEQGRRKSPSEAGVAATGPHQDGGDELHQSKEESLSKEGALSKEGPSSKEFFFSKKERVMGLSGNDRESLERWWKANEAAAEPTEENVGVAAANSHGDGAEEPSVWTGKFTEEAPTEELSFKGWKVEGAVEAAAKNPREGGSEQEVLLSSQASIGEEPSKEIFFQGWAPQEQQQKNPQTKSVVNSGEPRKEESSCPGQPPRIEFFCPPNQVLTSDAWKVFFYHMLPFTTVPHFMILACLGWAYHEWGWNALLFYTSMCAFLTFATPIYSRRVRAMTSDYFYGLLARYVPSAQYVVPEKPFKENQPYIFACHPHGRMFYSTIIFSQRHQIWRQNILKTGDLFMTAAGMFFMVPLIRNVFYMLGAIPVEKKDIIAKLKKKDHVTILIGGVKEVLLGTEDDVDILYLKKRKGFCKIAVQEKAGVVPVYFFNENQMFRHNSKSFLRFWERVNKYVKVGVPFMRGRFFILPMPFRRPLLIAVGEPLFPKEGESVDAFHERYVKALRELFDKYVPYSPKPNHKLKINFEQLWTLCFRVVPPLQKYTQRYMADDS